MPKSIRLEFLDMFQKINIQRSFLTRSISAILISYSFLAFASCTNTFQTLWNLTNKPLQHTRKTLNMG